LAAFTNITEQKTTEEELSKSEKKALALVAELEKADKSKSEFISVLSHELRNPLAAILAGMEVLEITKDTRQKAKVKEIMNRQTNQLCKLVDDLLELTRINQNMIKLKRKIIDLNEAIEGVIEDFQYEFEMKGIELEAKIQTEQIMLYADPVRLTQAVGNLLHNALKFTHKGGKVCLKLQQENEDAVIGIQDNGIGIDAEILPNLFTPFMQVDTSLERCNSGLGLGLSIVKSIVDLHGGTVSAHSEGLDMGASFSIRLPMITDDTYWIEQQITGLNHQKNLKVLIIEDNRDFAQLLCTMLSTLDCCVTIAYDGEEGLTVARQTKPDVVFCDIGLPLRNGYDVAASIRQDMALKDIYLIALSGYAYEKDKERALEAGFDKHLAKPVDIAILKEVLKIYE
jgi:CheY-like chemotaxis protein/nitrogen-specific signal transduction histidine kinase